MEDNILDKVLEGLKKISQYNELGGRGHGDLKDTCYICGISPKELSRQIQALVEQQVLIGCRESIDKAIKTWISQGRSEEDIKAIRNFQTGALKAQLTGDKE